MKRIRFLGVALVAALSLMAVLGSASAGASWIASESSVKAAPSGTHTFGAPGLAKFQCTAPSFEVKGPVATKSLDSGALGDYTECGSFGSTILKSNGCHLIFRPGTEKSAGVFGGTFEIGPAGCGPMYIEYNSGFCKLQFAPKSNLSAEYTNSGSGAGSSVTVKLNATGLETSGACSGKGSEGTYSGTYVLTAAQGVQASETKFFVDGEESKAKFNASTYSSTWIEGTLAEAMVIKTPTSGSATCGSASLLSHVLAASNTADFRGGLTCSPVFGFASVTTEVNGCYFRFQVLTGSSPAWGGKSSIVCDNAGEAIKIIPKSFGVPVCTFSIPAQEIDATTSYVNWEKGVLATVDREGLTHTGTGGACGSGTQSDAKLNATFKLGPGYSAP